MVHKSFPYAPCINISQPSDLVYMCNNPSLLSSHSHLIAHTSIRLNFARPSDVLTLARRSDVVYPARSRRRDCDVISPTRLHECHSLAPTWFSPLLALWRDFSSDIRTTFWRGNYVYDCSFFFSDSQPCLVLQSWKWRPSVVFRFLFLSSSSSKR